MQERLSKISVMQILLEKLCVENGIYYLARAHGIMYKDGQFITGVDWRGNGEISDGITY